MVPTCVTVPLPFQSNCHTASSSRTVGAGTVTSAFVMPLIDQLQLVVGAPMPVHAHESVAVGLKFEIDSDIDDGEMIITSSSGTG